MTNFRKAFYIIISLYSISSAASGTVIGNGGDPIFEFLNAARSSMVETIRSVVFKKEELDKFCSSDKIEMEKQRFCRHFFEIVGPQIIELNRGQDRTKFALKEEALYVEGPDGKPMAVAARTQLGPLGVVEFHRGSVKTMIPTQVLFLISHESQHKVEFEGKSISDNQEIGPFADGRELLDTVASALTEVAKKKGFIGSQFGIQDIFDCSVEADDSSFGARIPSARRFSSDDLMSYETSMGKNPTDGTVFLPETSGSKLLLRMMISEPNNCGGAHVDRFNQVQIVRSISTDEGFEEEVLAERMFFENPMCPQAKHDFGISYEQVSFSCNYFGSTGTTSSQYSVFSKEMKNSLSSLESKKESFLSRGSPALDFYF